MLYLLYLIPKNMLSRAVGWLVRVEKPSWFAKLILHWFVKRYKIDLSQAEYELEYYSCLGNFFTRNLKPGMRVVTGGIVCPVDGVLRDITKSAEGTLLSVKDKTYKIAELLNDNDLAVRFHSGWLANFYLTPRHYHHIHSPVQGRIIAMRHIPGNLWPVNDWSLHHIDKLFCINERVVVYLETNFGLVAVVMVGATNVGKISVTFEPELATNLPNLKDDRIWNYPTPIDIKAGERLGTFHMGSTVLVIFERSELIPVINSSQEVCFGQLLFK